MYGQKKKKKVIDIIERVLFWFIFSILNSYVLINCTSLSLKAWWVNLYLFSMNGWRDTLFHIYIYNYQITFRLCHLTVNFLKLNNTLAFVWPKNYHILFFDSLVTVKIVFFLLNEQLILISLYIRVKYRLIWNLKL